MLWKKVGKTRVAPVTLKIVLAFSLFILLSSFTTNYINLIYTRSVLLNLMNQLLVKDLKNVYSYCSNQYQIYKYDKDLESSVKTIETKGLHEIKNDKAIILGIKTDGKIFFQSSKEQYVKKYRHFTDKETLGIMKTRMNEAKEHPDGKRGDEGYVYFSFNDETYFGIYKYNPNWEVYILRAEELNEFHKETNRIFWIVSIMIIAITLLIGVIGIFILRHILRYIDTITTAIMKMVEDQELGLIDMSNATNDDITYLGTAFNSLSSTIDNLVSIFRKFANKDIVHKAYKDREIRLEGSRKELTVLFTDIKSFTFITETLGTDIIKLLNLHYDRAIREINNYDGVIGSIIGDALLAVFGVLEDSYENKSYQSILSAYKIQDVAGMLREEMNTVKDKLEMTKGTLTKDEERVHKAVLLEVGVGIDGGEVFYGTLGSYIRMTNTVIGDTVNSASRLEGLTRVYKTPVICSEFIKLDIEANVEDHGMHFLEIDTVMVKGKTMGKKVYWPILESDIDDKMKRHLSSYKSGLILYYEGDWVQANKKFSRCKLPMAAEFKQRTTGKCPKDWNGIWEMKTK
ncbi:MAG: adenylate/guanylate cyclase domain-containing protein [bacterium]|nr:adenylate/guanylate cyclase domain-containing protein [bacterium]